MTGEWKRDNVKIKIRSSDKIIDLRKQYVYFETKLIKAKMFIMKTLLFMREIPV
jgi:hypothetical protein